MAFPIYPGANQPAMVQPSHAIRTWLCSLSHLGRETHILIDQRFGSAALVPAFTTLHVAALKGFFTIIATVFTQFRCTQARFMRTRFYNVPWPQSVSHKFDDAFWGCRPVSIISL